MYRTINNQLLNWKQSKKRKPLLLRGARQVGKTWVVRQLGQTFDSYVEVNLEKQPELDQLFKENFGKPKLLVKQLNLLLNVRIEPGKTLLFFDEIQENKNALISLRYFYEEMPNLHVIAAGSLIEFALKEISFPVGRIQFHYMFPLNFAEYLIALGRSDLLAEIQQLPSVKISDGVHEKINEELKTYLFIGGMPEVVQSYLDQRDMRLCSQIQNDLINNFRQDFNKYASRSRVPHLRLVF
ncbi:MAG TPA: AAA family ATPase, partial [Pseudobdellovibrionaceae bacterium]